MTVFDEKLASLPATVQATLSGPIVDFAAAIREGAGRPAISIGSGGSAITAEFFARCRSTLGMAPTIVLTPMEFVVAQESWPDCDVWLFSAGADNPDVAGALTAALETSAHRIRLVTVNPEGGTALAASQHSRVELLVAPVSERKDGFLATHSLVAMVASLLAASELIAEPSQEPSVLNRYLQGVVESLSGAHHSTSGFRPGDTLMVLHDPQCKTIATLLETSLWETGIAPVQRVDFRNFAHGRHVWAAKHPDTMFVIAIVAATSRDIWKAIREALPASIRIGELDLDHAGRFKTALSVVDGLMMVKALGTVAGVDPGKPGRGSYAEAIYGDPGLSTLARKLDAAVRHKLAAVQLHDNPSCPSTAADIARGDWISTLESARIGAIVLDYDGTLVTTEARRDPPSPELVEELTRLSDSGITIAFATGRGGSVGDSLRAALPAHLHSRVTVGYYNGGHIRTLDVNIDAQPPLPDPDLPELVDWVENSGLLKPGTRLKRRPLQITVDHADILAPADFGKALTASPIVAGGKAKIVSSHHSFDLLPIATSKTLVTTYIGEMISADTHVFAIGDSGEPGGNDTELLAQSPSISVDGVCGNLNGCWTMFGKSASGPSALLRILRALRVENGHARLDLDSLGAIPA